MSIGLILEGGGTRGAYTAGVLDVLAENNIYFPVVYGISAGACNALSYLSKQNKRNYQIFTRYTSDKRYMSFSSLCRTGNIFGFDFIFGELASELLPFNYEEFFRSEMQLKVGATDCRTGKAVFFEKSDMKRDFSAVIASSSIPVVSKIVDFKGYKLLDGGVSAPIPIEFAINDGTSKNVIVLTREKSYVKKEKSDFPKPLLKRKYRDYPKLIDAVLNRAKVYNHEREICYSEQEKGNAIVIEPSSPITISRYCTKPEKMEELYDMGVRDAREKLIEIRRFIALNSI